MADPIVDPLNAVAVKEIWPRRIVDQFFKATPFGAYLRAKCLVPFTGGAFMQNTHAYAPMIGGAYAMGSEWNLTKRQTITATYFDPKYYEVAVPEYLPQILVEAVGELAAFSLVDTDLSIAMNTITAITCVDLSLHGQASGTNITGNRPNNMSGWIEAINDGITPGWEASIFPNYGTQPRNGVVKSTLNSVPLFVGNTATGAAGPISYPVFEESYQDACVGSKEPDLGVCNKAMYAYIKEKLQPQQRFTQERDPYWGASGIRFNNAIILKDDYFPSKKYGVNDPDLGNYLTSTFVCPAGADANSGLSGLSGSTITVGEVFCWFRMADWMLRIADNPIYGYGFGGFVPAQGNDRVVGVVRAMQQLQCLSPRTQKQLFGANG